MFLHDSARQASDPHFGPGLRGSRSDRLRKVGIEVFGPGAQGARLEGDKEFAKEVLAAAGVPTPRYSPFSSSRAALKYLDTCDLPIVVKACGAAQGKGVAVCSTRDEAEAFIRECLDDQRFGTSGLRILLEECVFGEELSVLVITDGIEKTANEAIEKLAASGHRLSIMGVGTTEFDLSPEKSEGLYQAGPDAIYLSPAPLYHAAPLRFNMSIQRLGGTCIVMDKFDAIEALHARCRGGYAVVALIVGHGIVAFRDPHGIRPLVLGERSTEKGADYMFIGEINTIVDQEEGDEGYRSAMLALDAATGETVEIRLVAV